MVAGIHYRDFREEDLEWVLLAMVASMRATMPLERAAAAGDITLLGEARADFDRYHHTNGADKLIVACHDRKKIGLVWITMEQLHQDPGAAWLLEIFVEPEYRRQGLARELMGHAEGWARERGAKEIWLNVGGSNNEALALYRAQGYGVATMHLSKRISDHS